MIASVFSAEFWYEFFASGTFEALLVGCAVLLLFLTAIQVEWIWEICTALRTRRNALDVAREAAKAGADAARKDRAALDQDLPGLEAAVAQLRAEHDALALKAAEARRELIREIILSDIFVPPGHRPYVSVVRRLHPAPNDPLASAWQAGREHVLYASDPRSALLRFERRFPAERGYTFEIVIPFDARWVT
jgi:hypothetical protein